MLWRRISIPNSPPEHCLGLVAVGSDIYNIGGSEKYSPGVSILDCRSHTWREAPSMLVERNRPAANIIDGKIYVAGGCRESKSSNWMEAFDLKTQTWELVFNPIADTCETRIRRSAVIGEAIYLVGDNFKPVTYNPKTDRWEAIRLVNHLNLLHGYSDSTYCVIDNVLYCYNGDCVLQWYDSKIGCWMKLTGLDGLPKFHWSDSVKLADYGGKMAVFWERYLPSNNCYNKVILCAVITIGRRDNEEVYGKVEWLDAVLTVPEYYEFVCARTATV